MHAYELKYTIIPSLPHHHHQSHFRRDHRDEMKLTIIAPDMVYEHEVDPSMQVQDIVALVEAEVSGQ
jgi:hypothetical protein